MTTDRYSSNIRLPTRSSWSWERLSIRRAGVQPLRRVISRLENSTFNEYVSALILVEVEQEPLEANVCCATMLQTILRRWMYFRCCSQELEPAHCCYKQNSHQWLLDQLSFLNCSVLMHALFDHARDVQAAEGLAEATMLRAACADQSFEPSNEFLRQLYLLHFFWVDKESYWERASCVLKKKVANEILSVVEDELGRFIVDFECALPGDLKGLEKMSGLSRRTAFRRRIVGRSCLLSRLQALIFHAHASNARICSCSCNCSVLLSRSLCNSNLRSVTRLTIIRDSSIDLQGRLLIL